MTDDHWEDYFLAEIRNAPTEDDAVDAYFEMKRKIKEQQEHELREQAGDSRDGD